MQPAARWTASFAGIAVAALVSLGALHRNENDWAARYEAEAAARADRETAIETLLRERDEECAAMESRVALLESQLAREQEHRAAAEGKAEAAAQPVAELERAYARIRELEGIDAARQLIGDLKQVQKEQQTMTFRVNRRIEGDPETRAELAAQRIRKCLVELGSIDREEIPVIDSNDVVTWQMVPEGGLNQGVGFVESPAAGQEPQRLGERLNQGVDYAEPQMEEDLIELTELGRDVENAPVAKPLTR